MKESESFLWIFTDILHWKLILEHGGFNIKKKKERKEYEKQSFKQNTCGFTRGSYGSVIIRVRWAEEAGREAGDGRDH